MKRILLSVVLLALCLGLGAQNYNVLNEVAASRALASGCEGPYNFEVPALTAAPKGYTPFYISHYGRHGARYAYSSNTYALVKKVLDAAAEADALTPYGAQFYKDFLAFWETPYINTGDLVRLGELQHEHIARIMAQSFPEVFASGGKVLARSSTSQRAIVSMNAFTVSLQKYAPKVDIEANSFHENMVVVNATSAPRELLERYANDPKLPETKAAFRARKYDYDGILGTLFTDRGFLEEIGGRTQFIYELFCLWQGYRNYCDGDWMEGLFTEEQIKTNWEVDSYGQYADHGGIRYQQIPLLRDVITRANDAIATGACKADLRFGHDTVVNSFCPLLNLDGCGYMPASADDVKYWFQNYKTPMAANVQFVLYRSKKSPEILFKVLRNGIEATLPQLTPVSGPYYRWDDFCAWAETVYAAHPRIQ